VGGGGCIRGEEGKDGGWVVVVVSEVSRGRTVGE